MSLGCLSTKPIDFELDAWTLGKILAIVGILFAFRNPWRTHLGLKEESIMEFLFNN